MAKIGWQDIGELQNTDPDSIKRAIIIPAKEALRLTRFALSGNLTIADNAYAAIVTLGQLGNNTSQTLVHGTEYLLQNPLPTKPVGFTPIYAFDSNRTAIEIPNCMLNLARTDGLLGLTVNFERSHAAPYLAKTASFLVPNGGGESIVTGWTTEDSRGSVISESSGTWTVSEAGVYNITAWVNYGSIGASYTRNFMSLIVVSPSVNLARSDIDALLVNGAALNLSSNYKFAAGGQFRVTAFQTNAALASRTVPWALRVNRLYNDAPYAANVTGILWGG